MKSLNVALSIMNAGVNTSATKYSPRDNKRPQLLDAAACHFAESGYDAASMREIAAAAGMKAGSMYYYFPSKEDLLVAVHEEGIRRMSEEVLASLEGQSGPWIRLEVAMVTHLRALLSGGDYVRVVIKVLPRENVKARARLVALRDSYERIFTKLINALPLATSTDARHVRLMILGAMNWSPTWFRSDGDQPHEIAKSFVQSLRFGECP